MPSKRATSRSAPSSAPSTSSSPLANALLVAAALGAGVAMLVTRGRMSWPPNQLLSSIFTVAGCLAMVGPIVMARVDGGDRGLGELLWMTGGLLVWVFDVVAMVRGDWRTVSWATPLGAQTMGLTILAVLLAGWRCRLVGRNWSWTNVTGWLLGIYWVGMALFTFLPQRTMLTSLQ
jgi:hypothetical protein